ncbi:MAG: polymerase, beta domain protein region protein [Candidatus Beckwithbacteria bacterium GW2011_GWC2_47_9]|uniref:Polymerase, beta domain protein region protein n=3 Tax=Candidatus Beckwithiibacteriota TaxID=1752726 RepID=A0A0G1TZD0_9BACT|nr:MAG: polymerase, beta domain protein region protein [Candidatus Beckwithbacteria bacterium GW2011_GWC2_47_9]OGD57059.1 MAG: nucleotidyltransferase [Candidatus Beckwithbacteria bacterium RIFCSPHIGHO2_12_FULL_47_17]OGD58679.1 MAG: nucleotidyltransferase [Candidatus Beckwithbacteria bacterium RIFCSPLOWO2_02_FULL_47_23]HCE48640.1 nucleotidyltransferase [Candidatus Jacksonbacteria bacterium]
MVTNKQQVINTLKQNSRQLKEFGVEKMGIFGSFVSGMQNNNSDVDLLVQFKKGQKNFRNFMGTADLTEALLGRNVDLLTPESLSPYIGPRIEKEVEYVQIA